MSLQLLFPREFATGETGLQPSGRVSGSRNTVIHSYTKFSHVVRCEAGSVFTHLGPNKFNRIELWSLDRKIIHMHTRILGKKLLHELTFVDGMVVPHQNYLARNDPQHLLQESDHLFAPQTAPIRARGLLAPAAIRPDQQCTQQVQPLVMLQAGADGRRLSTWRPTALERRDQRETAFIFKYQRGSQFTPLFLSLARPAASRKQSRPVIFYVFVGISLTQQFLLQLLQLGAGQLAGTTRRSFTLLWRVLSLFLPSKDTANGDANNLGYFTG